MLTSCGHPTLCEEMVALLMNSFFPKKELKCFSVTRMADLASLENKRELLDKQGQGRRLR